MDGSDIFILLIIAFLVGWAVWDWRRRKNNKGFVFTMMALAPILMSLASMLFGMWGCHKIKDAIFGKEVTKTEIVIDIESGNLVTLKSGLLNRTRRTKNCTLWGIAIPKEVASQAKENLQRLISPKEEIRVVVKEGGDGWVDNKWGDISGVPISKNGENCCLEQLRAGLAKATVDDKALVAAQKEAQKAHRGIWSKKTKDVWKEISCDNCQGTGKVMFDGMILAKGCISVWLDGHTMTCKVCKEASIAGEGEPCAEAAEKWQFYLDKYKDMKPTEDQCPFCQGSGKVLVEE